MCGGQLVPEGPKGICVLRRTRDVPVSGHRLPRQTQGRQEATQLTLDHVADQKRQPPGPSVTRRSPKPHGEQPRVGRSLTWSRLSPAASAVCVPRRVPSMTDAGAKTRGFTEPPGGENTPRTVPHAAKLATRVRVDRPRCDPWPTRPCKPRTGPFRGEPLLSLEPTLENERRDCTSYSWREHSGLLVPMPRAVSYVGATVSLLSLHGSHKTIRGTAHALSRGPCLRAPRVRRITHGTRNHPEPGFGYNFVEPGPCLGLNGFRGPLPTSLCV